MSPTRSLRLELLAPRRAPTRDAFAAVHRGAQYERPAPPQECDDDVPVRFVPDPAFAHWLRDVFIAATGPLENEDHAHLADARLGVLWTNCPLTHQQMTVVATAEMPMVMGGAWKRGRAEQQLADWFGASIDFLLTFHAQECERLDDRAFCAVVEHELYHCAQQLDAFGVPKFSRETGLPLFAMRGHDAEEFVGVVRRYGKDATSQGTRALIDAARRAPEIGAATLDVACGTCHRRVG